MAGIRINTPQGTGWEYSLDDATWQTSRIFNTLPGGAAFVVGVKYDIYCRNIPQNSVALTSIVFGQPTNEETLINLWNTASLDEQISFTTAFLTLINATPGVKTLFCHSVSSCSITSYPPTFSDFEHFEFLPVAQSLSPVYRLRLDSNTCGDATNPPGISGWVVDLNHPTLAPFVRIKKDGVFAADVTATIDRPDVLGDLKSRGLVPQDQTFCRWGWGYTKASSTSDGLPHTWQVFGGTSDTEATSDEGAPTTLTCGTPTPTSTYRRTGAVSAQEGGAGVQLGLERQYTNGSWQPVDGSLITWSTVGSPSGIGVNSSGIFQAGANTITANASVEVHAAVNDQVVVFYQQVLNADCFRPGSLTTYALAWNFTPTGGYARLFPTLADANTTVGAQLDQTTPGSLATFFCNIESITVGKLVYNGVGTGCELVSDSIYYVFANGVLDTIKKAITVQNGVITAILASAYSACANSAPLTTQQRDALPVVTIYEYDDPSTPNGGLSYTVRPFATRDEALLHLSRTADQGSKAHFDLNTCTSTSPSVGDTLYNDDRVEHVLAGTQSLYAVEAGYWGYSLTMPVGATAGSVTLLKTNACGIIIGRETITLPGTAS